MENGYYLLLIRGSGYYYQIIVGEIEIKGFEIKCKGARTITSTGTRIPSELASLGASNTTQISSEGGEEWLWRPDIVRAFKTDPALWK